jgi:uncharacterized membrane protein YeaQ/YmgE (transglycosylase-associated protein family)
VLGAIAIAMGAGIMARLINACIGAMILLFVIGLMKKA